MRSVFRSMLFALVALILTACASPAGFNQRVSEWWTSHTMCYPTMYLAPRWTVGPDPSAGPRVIYQVTTGNETSIRWVSPSGGDDHLLVSGAVNPVPSPDGRWLLYETYGTQPGQYPASTLLDLATQQSRKLGVYVGSAPAWSPDSRWIAYNYVNNPLIKVDVATGQTTRLAATPTELLVDFAPQWSPSGDRVLFSAESDSRSNLFVVNADGSGLTQVASAFEADCTEDSIPIEEIGAWDADGETIQFLRRCGPKATLSRVDLDGVELPTKDSSWASLSVVRWSPDRTRILGVDYSGVTAGLYVSAVDGSGRALLARDVWDASWSPDGSQIAFVGYDNSTGLGQLWVINADGTGLKLLTQNPGVGNICIH